MLINIITLLSVASRKSPKDDRETVSERHELVGKTVSEIGRKSPSKVSQVVYFQRTNKGRADIATADEAHESEVITGTRVLHFGNGSYLATDAVHVGISVASRSYDLFRSRKESCGREVCHG
jgi:hypothetical protein